jgi:photosystem II stability/assembly factor-like uncharacterized protein
MKFALLLLFIPFFAAAQRYDLKELNSGTNTSLRGVCVVSDQVAWVSGSNGSIGRTINGGSTWEWIKPAGFEKLDFRDIEAFDAENAIAVTAGSPAYILKTDNGGKSWSQMYVNRDSAVFLDGMDFWDRQTGIVFGDPLKNKLQILRTVNGGLSWQDISGNLKEEMKLGEAGFAASGSSIKTLDNGKVWIATGGSVSNIYYSKNYGKDWKKYACPIIQGSNSTGAFSLDFLDDKHGLVVGGDYLQDKKSTNNVLLTRNGGKSWNKPVIPVLGYRSSVVYFNKSVCFAAGSSGIDLSEDGGITWNRISETNINAIGKAKSGSLVLLTGNKGEIYQLSIRSN